MDERDISTIDLFIRQIQVIITFFNRKNSPEFPPRRGQRYKPTDFIDYREQLRTLSDMVAILPLPLKESIPLLSSWPELHSPKIPTFFHPRSKTPDEIEKFVESWQKTLIPLVSEIRTYLDQNLPVNQQELPFDIPPQNRGIRMDIENGKIVRDRTIDTDGNDYAQIDLLKPALLEALTTALDICSSGNKAFGLLADRLSAYRLVIDTRSDKINFALLFSRAASIENALNRAKQRSQDPEDADLDEEAANAIETLLDLHKPIMMASGMGESIQQGSLAWDTTPEQYKRDKANIGEARQGLIDNPGIIDDRDKDDIIAVLTLPEGPPDIKRTLMAARTATNIGKVLMKKPLYHLVGAGLFIIPAIGPAAGALVMSAGFVKGLESEAGDDLKKGLEDSNDKLVEFLSDKFEVFAALTERVDQSPWMRRLLKRQPAENADNTEKPEDKNAPINGHLEEDLKAEIIHEFEKETAKTGLSFISVTKFERIMFLNTIYRTVFPVGDDLRTFNRERLRSDIFHSGFVRIEFHQGPAIYAAVNANVGDIENQLRDIERSLYRISMIRKLYKEGELERLHLYLIKNYQNSFDIVFKGFSDFLDRYKVWLDSVSNKTD